MNEDDLVRAQDLLTLPPDAPQVESADPDTQAAIDRARSWTGGPNVVGSGVAPKVTSGLTTSELALKLYVTEKLPERTIPRDQRIPSSIEVPAIPGTLPTDVEAIGDQQLQLLSSRIRPLVPGYSVGRLGGSPGTLGAIVAKVNGPLNPLLLSNSHVIAQYGLATPGMIILQPAPRDGGGEADSIATLLESTPFDFNPGFNNLCDAAIASITNIINVKPDIPLIGVPSGVGPVPAPGTQVQKTGRTTGHTTGLVKDVHYRTLMSYPRPGGGWGTLGFRDQVLCEKYSDGGDSGSLVCDMQGKAVGLHWAGSTSTSVFSPIASVFSALGVELWRGGV